MFAVVTRSVPRRALAHGARRMSQRPPAPPPPPTSNGIPETPAAPPPAESTSIPASGLPSLDFSPSEPEEPQRTGAKSSKGSLSSSERKRRFMGRVSLAVLALAFGVNVVYMGREWEEEELLAKKMVRLELGGYGNSLDSMSRFRHLRRRLQRGGIEPRTGSQIYSM